MPRRTLLALSLGLFASACAADVGGTGSERDAGRGDAGRDASAADASTADGGTPFDSSIVFADATVVECDQLRATVRDFRDSFADMERDLAFQGDDRGIVETMLGTDGKPVYAHTGPTRTVSSPESFAMWYRDVSTVNQAVTVMLPLTETAAGSGVFVYDNSAFFPVDGLGFGNEGRDHNFHFTTEIAATFLYKGGEEFTFRGDDDVFVFVNRRLALDLGGVHNAEEGTIDFDEMADELGITTGRTYELHVFHAERHTVESNFRIETSIDCFVLL